jgi:hypothetical protein
MTKMPKRSTKWRPDFEAPGPYVTIESKEGINIASPMLRDPFEEEDEEVDFSHYRYYKSDKVLGKLYRAIDERELFDAIQKHSTGKSAAKYSRIIDSVWEHVQHHCKLIEWRHKVEWARDLRDQ